MAYSADKKPGELTTLTSLATDDVFVVGDASDASEVAKGITKANLITDLTTSFATAGHDHTGVYAPALGADDNYVTDAEKTKLSNLSGTNTGDQDLSALAPKASPTFTGTVTLPVGLTGVIRADTGVVSVDTDVTDLVSAASDTVAGKVEISTTAETNTGTDTGRAVSPDALAGSYAGTKSVSIQVTDGTTDVTTGDGKAYLTIPEALNGMNLVRAQATVVTAGTTNATTVMIHNKTDAQDMLSGAISIASAGTVGTVGTVNATYDDVATNDVLRIDVDSVSTTAPKGLMVILEFRLP